MKSPFMLNDWYNPSAKRTPMKTRTSVPAPAKVVSIPVKFIESGQSKAKSVAEEARIRLYSATAIQKVFRGFLVRKSVRQVAEIRGQVDEIAEKISKEEAVELMRRDSKEKLKVNETLMRLLLRLDSVRGVDSGVRDFRKRVIKKAIALQEIVDSISAQVSEEGDECIDETLGTQIPGESKEGEAMEDMRDAPMVNECGDGMVTDSEARDSDDRESVGSVGILERMLEENKRMMEMMRELHDRTETQTQLLSSLANRVEEMERAAQQAQRLKRKKKRNTDTRNKTKYGKRG